MWVRYCDRNSTLQSDICQYSILRDTDYDEVSYTKH